MWLHPAILLALPVSAQEDPLPSWNEGAAKQAILTFVAETTDPSQPGFVPREERIATFDQDGTLWVEHPMPTQLRFVLDRVPGVVAAKPALRDTEPYETVLSGDQAAIAKLGTKDLETLLGATLTGMTVGVFTAEARAWLERARDPRWDRPYTDLVYQPMLEAMRYLRANGYETWIVTGGGQDFVRAYADEVYGIPVDQIIGSAGAVRYGYDADGKPILTREPALLLNDDKAGKPEGIHLGIGRRPRAAFGNSTGDQQMLEYTKAGSGPRLAMILLHDDATREYAYGPAEGLPTTSFGRFPQSLYTEATEQGWIVVSMKEDWKRVFAWQ